MHCVSPASCRNGFGTHFGVILVPYRKRLGPKNRKAIRIRKKTKKHDFISKSRAEEDRKDNDEKVSPDINVYRDKKISSFLKEQMPRTERQGIMDSEVSDFADKSQSNPPVKYHESKPKESQNDEDEETVFV